jgi:hypothetical protein
MGQTQHPDLQAILKRRRAVDQTSPYEIKLLALEFGLTQGQIRGLLLKHGDDRARLADAARTLRAH